MTYFPKGKHVNIDKNNPEAVGICDYSGLPFLRKDLVKQYEWRGNALVWNGFLVGRPYVDVPNEQARPPILPPDPIPVTNPRPPQGSIETWASNTLPPWNYPEPDSLPSDYPAQTWGNVIATNFDGIPAVPGDVLLASLQNFQWGY